MMANSINDNNFSGLIHAWPVASWRHSNKIAYGYNLTAYYMICTKICGQAWDICSEQCIVKHAKGVVIGKRGKYWVSGSGKVWFLAGSVHRQKYANYFLM